MSDMPTAYYIVYKYQPIYVGLTGIFEGAIKNLVLIKSKWNLLHYDFIHRVHSLYTCI